MLDNLILSNQIKFDSKPDAVPYQYRLSYRIALTCLILKLTCGRSGCSLSKLHLITVYMYSKESKDTLLSYINYKNQNAFITLRFDPTVNKTIDFMLADEFIFQQSNGLFRLTKKGKSYTTTLITTKNILVEEKSFLNQLSTNLDEDVIKKISNSLMR
ncbi:hypothetical protein [Viridibacillus arvi]|uniref:hypothetical protein n=1 Tax=Viridibacillus arvi TaxID=263475 RepID=UPI003D282BFA